MKELELLGILGGLALPKGIPWSALQDWSPSSRRKDLEEAGAGLAAQSPRAAESRHVSSGIFLAPVLFSGEPHGWGSEYHESSWLWLQTPVGLSWLRCWQMCEKTAQMRSERAWMWVWKRTRLHCREQEDGSLLALWCLRSAVLRLLGPLTGRVSLLFFCLRQPQWGGTQTQGVPSWAHVQKGCLCCSCLGFLFPDADRDMHTRFCPGR